MARGPGRAGSRRDVYAITGLQNLPFNTLFQLVAARGTAGLAAARRLLLMPDLLGYWLTGDVGRRADQRLDHRAARRAHPRVGDRPDRPARPPARRCCPPLRGPGEPDRSAAARGGGGDRPGPGAGDRRRLARHRLGRGRRARRRRPVRLHLLRHLVAGRRRARRAGADRGEPGGQLHQRGRRRRHRPLPAQRDGAVAAAGVAARLGRPRATVDLDGCWPQAAAEPAFAAVVDPDDPVFLPPGDMPARIAAACRRTGQPVPAGPAATVRCILDSLALAHRRAVRRRASGSRPDGRRGAHRRRRRPQRAAVPAHRGRLRAAGGGRAGRGDRVGQRRWCRRARSARSPAA